MPTTLSHHTDADVTDVAHGLVALVGPAEASAQLTRLYGWDRSFQVLTRLQDGGRAAYHAVAQLPAGGHQGFSALA